MGRHLLLIAFFMFSPNLYGSSGSPPSPPKGDPHAAKPAGEHGESEEKPTAPTGPQREYNPGKVFEFPSFKATVVGTSEEVSYAPKKGRAVMVFFISSWCEPCQVLMTDFKQLARKYSNSSISVYFVFAHDTKKDAEGFKKEHQIAQTSIMANVELLSAFKNPEIPSVYLGDKWGYLADRFIKVKKADINTIDEVMSKINAL